MRKSSFTLAGVQIPPGTSTDIRPKISETYTGDSINMPMRVIRARKKGPTVFISAALHGDEVNGTGIVHDLMFPEPLKLVAGTIILIPVINVFGFENNVRYLPDRRDLNRSFPGSENGSMAGRMAYTFMKEIVEKCDYGIDLHSAAFQRTNYPNVRGDLSNPGVLKLADAFGCEMVVDGKGPAGSLRREACKAGCPTIILEAGEPWKIEPSVLEIGLRGVLNVLISLGMYKGKTIQPAFQFHINRTTWVRAEVGGILRFHISPGDVVFKNDPIATNYSILGKEKNTLYSPADGLILGMATMPAVKPGEPVCNIARIPKGKLRTLKRDKLHRQAHTDLATSVSMTDHSP